ncbi:MAG: FMN-binding protein [Candidatus Omnitrophota bacterium]
MRYRYVTLLSITLLALCLGISLKREASTGTFNKDALRARGYGGTIAIILTTDQEQHITSLRVLAHNETPSYIGDLGTFLGQFIGKGPGSALTLGEDIDGITRATITSAGITRAVRERLRPTPSTASEPVSLLPAIPAFLLLSLALAALLLKNTALRWLAMLGGFIYFGLIERSMLSIIQVINAATLHTPGLDINILWLICLIIGFIPALFIGRIYCGSLCPLALVQELLAITLPKRLLPKAIPPEQIRTAKTVKYLIAIILIGLCLTVGNAAPANIEPFITLFTLHGTCLAWCLLGLILVISLFYFRFWCLYLCPVGALTGLVARWSLFKPAPSKECSSCGLCAAKCPTQAIEKTPAGLWTVDMTECILCGECLKECRTPKNATSCFVLKCPYGNQ